MNQVCGLLYLLLSCGHWKHPVFKFVFEFRSNILRCGVRDTVWHVGTVFWSWSSAGSVYFHELILLCITIYGFSFLRTGSVGLFSGVKTYFPHSFHAVFNPDHRLFLNEFPEVLSQKVVTIWRSCGWDLADLNVWLPNWTLQCNSLRLNHAATHWNLRGGIYCKANQLIKLDTVKVSDKLVLFQPRHDTVVHGHEDEYRDDRPGRRGRWRRWWTAGAQVRLSLKG